MFRNYNFILILIGAIPGAVLRWQLQNYILANLIGALVIGIIIGMKLSASTNLILGFGFCGSLTTYSSWLINSAYLLFNGDYLEALFSTVSMILIGLTFSFIGYNIGKGAKHLMLIQ